jgi:hypothetical protein
VKTFVTDHPTEGRVEVVRAWQVPAILTAERERLTGEIKQRLEVAAKELNDSAQTDQERALVSVASRLTLAALDSTKGEGDA